MQKSVVVIDNYDSFTYNLVQYVQTLGARCTVHLNDRVSVAQVADLRPNGVLLSPGPGTPNDAGVTLDVVAQLSGKIPILGVCLGHQSIGQAFGARIVRAEQLMHGKTSMVYHDDSPLFGGVPSPFEATRYHSLVIDPGSVPDSLHVTAQTADKEIMGIAHTSLSVVGVQFHPESFLTAHGMRLIENWLRTL